ncbi:MAG TPA: MMPL family transporter [Acidothermaceae bacterium]|jgi:RND superfamily putative drug exporter
MKTLANFAVKHRWLVVAAWIIFIFVAQGISGALGGPNYKDTFSLPHTETASVTKVLKSADLANQSGATGTVVLKAKTGTLASPPAALAPALVKLCSAGHDVAGITTPWQTIDCTKNAAVTAGDPKLLNTANGSTTGLVDLTWINNHYDLKLFTGVYNDLKTLRSSALQVEFTGNAFQGVGQAQGVPPFLFGFIAALIILVFVFRTVGATVLPLASAVGALGAGLGLIGILTHAMNVSNITPELTELMVLGVGVDYALFIVTRHRRNLRRGIGIHESIVTSMDTSGRAVLFAATTVCIALLGLLALGVSFFNGMAIGAAVAVSLTAAASLTLLPALLSLFGLKVLPRTQRRAVRAGQFIEPHATGFWARWSGTVARHKTLLSLGAAAVIVVLALPFFSMRLGAGDQGNDPKGSTTRSGYDLIATGFGVGYNSTLEAVVDGPGATDPAYLQKVSTALQGTTGVDPTSVHAIPLNRTVAFVSFKSTTSPQDAKTYALVKDLRAHTLPPIYGGTANHVYVYGDTAIQVDFAKVLAAKLPIFIAAVVGLSFLLLLVAFRSLVIPLTAAVMNLLAAGASFGVVVAIFQYGWGADALGLGKGGPIDAWAPVMFFAILFGLSMDYQVFLVSRMYEEWLHTHDNKRAVMVGQAETGSIITAAALIMIAVFGGFVLGDERAIKIFGIGLATAVFLDAFLLRTILVPSLMHVLGDRNWYLPKWLDRITPKVSFEPPEEPITEQDNVLVGK